jgi:hypothetical protein
MINFRLQKEMFTLGSDKYQIESDVMQVSELSTALFSVPN